MYRSSVRPVARFVGSRRSPQIANARKYATAAEQTAARNSHIAAGVGGGAVVLLGVYGYYHYSGAAKAVNTVKGMSDTAKKLKDKAAENAPSPKAMLGFVRSAALSYGSMFPGASHLINSTFDQIDKVAEKNGPEVEKLVKQVYSDIQKAVSEGGDNVTEKIIAAIQESMRQIQNLSSQLGDSTIQPFLEKNPQLKDVVNQSLGQIQDFGDKYGPEAKKIADDTIEQVRNLVAGGLSAGAIAKASTLATQKLKEIRALGEKAGGEAYAKAAEGARPYLDKAPEVKKYFEDTIDSMKEYVGDDGVKLINETYAELEKAGKKGDTKQLMSIVKDKAEKLQKLAKEKGGDLAGKASEKASQIPGADKLFEAVPGLKDLSSLQKLAQEKGSEGEKLLNETYAEIKAVLEKKAGKAKELGKEAAGEAKKQVGK